MRSHKKPRTPGPAQCGMLRASSHALTSLSQNAYLKEPIARERGKPLNCYGRKRKVVYENEEFYLLQHALNIEEDLEGDIDVSGNCGPDCQQS